MKKLFALALATAALGAAPAMAQTGTSTDPIILRTITTTDTDRIQGPEPQIWNRDRWGRNEHPNGAHWLTWDTNKSGLLDDMEWKMIEDNWSGSSRQAWSEFDGNNDGKLDHDERGKVRDYFNQLQMRRRAVVLEPEE